MTSRVSDQQARLAGRAPSAIRVAERDLGCALHSSWYEVASCALSRHCLISSPAR